MSLEGGEFNCSKHNFTTSNVEEWDNHCYKKGHVLKWVKQICPNCGTEKVEENYPYPKNYVKLAHTTGSGIVIECKKCFGT